MSLGGLLIAAALVAVPTVETYLHMQEVGEAAISPDERIAVVQVIADRLSARTFDDETLTQAQRSRLQAWSSTASGVRRLWRRAAAPGPLSPSGRRMAVLRPRGHHLQLGVLRMADGAIRWLPVDVEAPGFGRVVQWVSDDALVALSPAPGAVPQALETGAAAERRAERLWSRQRWGRRPSVTRPLAAPSFVDGPRRLRLIDVASGASQTLMRGPVVDFEVAPGARRLAVLLRSERRPLADAQSLTVAEHLRTTTVALLDLADPTRTVACAGDAMSTLLSWSPDGRELLAATRDPGVFDWRRTQFVRLDPQGCQPLGAPLATPDLEASNGEGLPVVAAAWSDGQPTVGLPDGAGARRWLRLDSLRAPQPTPAPHGPAAESFGDAARARLAAAASGEAGACSRGSLLTVRGARRVCVEVSPQGVAHVRLEGDEGAHLLLRVNAQLERVRWARPEAISAGGLIHWLYRPAARSAAPLVVLPYPGAVYTHPPGAYAPGVDDLVTQAQIVAGHGYAVLVPSLRSSQTDRPDAGLPAQIEAAVDAAVAAGGVDERRIALWGHSFGGYAALIAAEASTRYAAVVAEHAPLDFVSSRGVLPFPARLFADPERYLEFQYGWTEGGQAGFGTPPSRRRSDYVDASATAHADRLTAPLLLISGDQDFVAPGQAEELAAELVRRGHPVQLLTYWGEGHVPLSPANISDAYRRSFAFIDDRLRHARNATARAISPVPLR